ncbi:MAG TPA: hypothetical protein VHC40_08080 [Rhizomicrobium sp.]|nr:hypothetical protein [Rhizomicrobium sp.]
MRSANLLAGLFAVLAVCVFAPVARAQGPCTEPVPPMPVDGSAVTADQLRAAMADARNFIAQSDIYQACLTNEVDAARTQAAADGRPFDPAIDADAKASIAASQKAKDKVSADISTAVTTYKQTHTN